MERVLRDVRINLIIEGTSEIMHLFIAREALDPHLGRLKNLLDTKSSIENKIKSFLSTAGYYAIWYPKLWLPVLNSALSANLPGNLGTHMHYVQKSSRRLARSVFHQMLRYQKKLEAKQSILNRIVDIGTELFAMAAACAYADHLLKKQEKEANALDLADLFCRTASGRVDGLFRERRANCDAQGMSVARKLLDRQYEWLENDIIK